MAEVGGHRMDDQRHHARRTTILRDAVLHHEPQALRSQRFAAAVRGHWSIENSLHWQLDVTFGEDQSRLRRGHADANFSILRRTALSLLKNNKRSRSA